MSAALTDLGGGFHHIRGSLRIGGLLNVGTHCALVEIEPDRFIFLDSYELDRDTHTEILDRTQDGKLVEAIVNLHPFHTLHVEWMHRAFPRAKLYGTERHHDKFPDLPWEQQTCEAAELPDLFAPNLEFSVPQGVAMVCDSEHVHFSSILAYHPASGTLFVDDTLSRVDLPGPLGILPMSNRLDFHPTLARALRPEAGAADAFREWVMEIGVRWADSKRIAMAHNTVLDLSSGRDLPRLLGEALGRVKPVLDRHRERYG